MAKILEIDLEKVKEAIKDCPSLERLAEKFWPEEFAGEKRLIGFYKQAVGFHIEELSNFITLGNGTEVDTKMKRSRWVLMHVLGKVICGGVVDDLGIYPALEKLREEFKDTNL